MTDQIDQVEILQLAASSFRQVALVCPARHHHWTTLHMLCLLQQLHLCLDHPTWRWCAPLDITTEGQIVRVVRARDQRYTLIIQIRNLSPIHKQVFILLLSLTHSSFTQKSLSSHQPFVPSHTVFIIVISPLSPVTLFIIVINPLSPATPCSLWSLNLCPLPHCVHCGH